MNNLKKLIILPIIASSSLIGSQAKKPEITASYVNNAAALSSQGFEKLKKAKKCPTVSGKHSSSEKIRTLAFECLNLCGHKNPELVVVTNNPNEDNCSGWYGLDDQSKEEFVQINFNEHELMSYGAIRGVLLHESFHLVRKHYNKGQFITTSNEDACLLRQNFERDADEAIVLSNCEQCTLERAKYFFEDEKNNKTSLDASTLEEYVTKHTKKRTLKELIKLVKTKFSDPLAKNKKHHPASLERALYIYKYCDDAQVKGKLCNHHKKASAKKAQQKDACAQLRAILEEGEDNGREKKVKAENHDSSDKLIAQLEQLKLKQKEKRNELAALLNQSDTPADKSAASKPAIAENTEKPSGKKEEIQEIQDPKKKKDKKASADEKKANEKEKEKPKEAAKKPSGDKKKPDFTGALMGAVKNAFQGAYNDYHEKNK